MAPRKRKNNEVEASGPTNAAKARKRKNIGVEKSRPKDTAPVRRIICRITPAEIAGSSPASTKRKSGEVEVAGPSQEPKSSKAWDLVYQENYTSLPRLTSTELQDVYSDWTYRKLRQECKKRRIDTVREPGAGDEEAAGALQVELIDFEIAKHEKSRMSRKIMARVEAQDKHPLSRAQRIAYYVTKERTPEELREMCEERHLWIRDDDSQEGLIERLVQADIDDEKAERERRGNPNIEGPETPPSVIFPTMRNERLRYYESNYSPIALQNLAIERGLPGTGRLADVRDRLAAADVNLWLLDPVVWERQLQEEQRGITPEPGQPPIKETQKQLQRVVKQNKIDIELHRRQNVDNKALIMCQTPKTVAWISEGVKFTAGCIKYRKKLGQGSYGAVHLVENKNDTKLYAVKTTRHPDSQLKDFSIYKAHIAAEHPNIVSLVANFNNVSFGPVTFFEYCSAGDLHYLINSFWQKGQVIPEAFIWHVYASLVEAVAFLQGTILNPVRKEDEPPKMKDSISEGMVHLDIKPQNVLLQWNDRLRKEYPIVKLGDFGGARHRKMPKRADDEHRHGEFKCGFGTQMFAPPETRRDRLGSFKSDIYGIGAVVHALIHSGLPPCNLNQKDFQNQETRKVKVKMHADSGAKGDPAPSEKVITLKRRLKVDEMVHKIHEPGLQYSQKLAQDMNKMLDEDYMKRPFAHELLPSVWKKNKTRQSIMFRGLPDWYTGEVKDRQLYERNKYLQEGSVVQGDVPSHAYDPNVPYRESWQLSNATTWNTTVRSTTTEPDHYGYSSMSSSGERRELESERREYHGELNSRMRAQLEEEEAKQEELVERKKKSSSGRKHDNSRWNRSV